MKKTWIVWGVVALFVVIAFTTFSSSYNTMIGLQKQAEKSWSDIETQYQRRVDLIPNLVNTVKGYANFEKSTLVEVQNARSKATQITISPKNLDANSMQKFQAAQGQVSSALGRLLAVAENYPNLKASEQFIGLQTQLESTENRIAVARRDYNDVVTKYNTKISLFPTFILARLFGFNEKPLFESDKGAEKAPTVKF